MYWTPEQIAKSWRFPDKMPEALPSKLTTFEKRGGYVFQQKLDGYRLVVMLEEGKVISTSRHQKALPVNQGLLDSLLAIGLPYPAMLDAEWMKMRGGEAEGIYLLDGLYIGGEWQGEKDLYTRRSSYYDKPLPPGIHVPKETTKNFIDFFVEQMAKPGQDPATTLAEGGVVKKIDARLLGSRTLSAENPNWAKIKWRHGQGGDTVVVSKEAMELLKAAQT